VNVAKFSEEFLKAVKCQSDLVLAGFLRNILKYDIYTKFMKVQHGNSQQVLDDDKYIIIYSNYTFR